MAITESFQYYTPIDFRYQAIRAFVIPLCLVLSVGFIRGLLAYFVIRSVYHKVMASVFKMHSL